jgi:hypothetical protein
MGTKRLAALPPTRCLLAFLGCRGSIGRSSTKLDEVLAKDSGFYFLLRTVSAGQQTGVVK